MSVDEGNKLIDEFAPEVAKRLMIYYKRRTPSIMKFHSSWDWLMPVVQKINDLALKYGYVDDMEIFHLRVVGLTTKSLFEAIVQFLKWYNQNKNNE